MTRLEDLVRPCHSDGHRRPKAKPNHEEPPVARPRVRCAACVGCHQQACDLDADGYAEEERAVVVEAVRERGHEQDRDEIHDPDRGGEETELHACEGFVGSTDDDCGVVLDADADADDAEVHQD